MRTLCKISILFILLGCFSCQVFQPGDDDDDDDSPGTVEVKDVEATAEDDGTFSVTLDKNSTQTQNIKAPESSGGGNSSISLPVGSMTSVDNLELRFGSDLAIKAGDGGQDYGLDAMNPAVMAGLGVEVVSPDAITPDDEFEISVELTSSQLMAWDRSKLIIMYQIMKLRRTQRIYGVIAPDSITLKDNIATFKARYFGIYRPASLNEGITSSTEVSTSIWSDLIVDNFDRDDTSFNADLDKWGSSTDLSAFLGSDWKALTNHDDEISGAEISIKDNHVKCVGACIAEYQTDGVSDSVVVRMGASFSLSSYQLSAGIGIIGVLDAANDGGCPVHAGFFCESDNTCKIGIVDKDNSTLDDLVSFGDMLPITPRPNITYVMELQRSAGTLLVLRLKTAAGLTIQSIEGEMSSGCVIKEPSFSFSGFDNDKQAIFDDFYVYQKQMWPLEVH